MKSPIRLIFLPIDLYNQLKLLLFYFLNNPQIYYYALSNMTTNVFLLLSSL